jgi:hypothetical protein
MFVVLSYDIGHLHNFGSLLHNSASLLFLLFFFIGILFPLPSQCLKRLCICHLRLDHPGLKQTGRLPRVFAPHVARPLSGTALLGALPVNTPRLVSILFNPWASPRRVVPSMLAVLEPVPLPRGSCCWRFAPLTQFLTHQRFGNPVSALAGHRPMMNLISTGLCRHLHFRTASFLCSALSGIVHLTFPSLFGRPWGLPYQVLSSRPQGSHCL